MSSYFRKIYWLYCSVRRFCLDNDCVIEFSPFGFCVKDRILIKPRQSLFKCNNPGLLYPFFPTDASVEAAYFCPNPTLWLQGLAHLNSHTLSDLLKKKLLAYNSSDSNVGFPNFFHSDNGECTYRTSYASSGLREFVLILSKKRI